MRNKYNNKKIEYKGIKFDSIKEKNRYMELSFLEAAGQIRELKLQPRFMLQEKFRDENGKLHREIAYIADFSYFNDECDKLIVEDVKGFKTDVFKIKEKLFLYKYGKVCRLLIT